MLKFRCQHCGQRIAVPRSHLGRLVTCAECGAQTHPLAEQLAAASAKAPPAPAAPGRAAEMAPAAAPAGACDNCGATIGRLQSSHAWEGHTICGACLPRLVGDSKFGKVAPAIADVPATVVARVLHEPGTGYVADAPSRPLAPELRERLLRGLIVFVVASVALYGALSLLRDVAGLIAVAAVAVLALLSLYALFRGAVAARRRVGRTTALVPRDS